MSTTSPEPARGVARWKAAFGRSALVAADQALVSGSNLLVTVLLVRALGLAEFGRFSLWWMALVFVQSLQQACVTTPLYSIGPKESRSADSDYHAAALRLEFWFLGVVACAAALLWLPVSRVIGLSPNGGELVALAAATGARSLHDFLRASGFARRRTRWVFVLDVVGYGGQLVALGLFGLTGIVEAWSATAALWAIAASAGLGVGVGLATFGSWRVAPGAVAACLRRHSGMARWLAPLSVSQWFTSNAYAAAAGVVLGTPAVAVLKAGQTLLGVLHVLLLAMENVVPVRAAEIAARGAWSELEHYFARLARVGLAATVVAAATIAAFAAPLSELVYGHASEELSLVIRVFAVHYVIVFAVAVASIRLRTHERTRPIFVAQVLGALVSFVVARPLVDAFGLAGALTGIVAQQALVLLVLLYAQRKTTEATVGASRIT
ncbi:MAG: hypothetical protein L6Q99_02170 [Planctomycetes bacterium]|nr:hypothetical protein [Planctomycetota bacterium]